MTRDVGGFSYTGIVLDDLPTQPHLDDLLGEGSDRAVLTFVKVADQPCASQDGC